MRAHVLVATALLAGVLTASASVSVQAWFHLGEPGTLPGGLPIDSSTNGNSMNDGFSEFESIHANANSPGGPLGTSGWTSTASSEWGRNGDIIIAARDAYSLSGNNFGIEAWVLPFENGYNVFCCEGSHNYTAQIFASGADSTGLYFGVQNNQDGSYSFVGDIITDDNGVVQVGNSYPLVTNGWTHLALIRSNSINFFFVNGEQFGLSNTESPSTNAPTGTGSQNGMRLGASGGDQVAYRGLIDEARAFTFDPSQFSTADLLYPSASATTPTIVSQPTDATAWDNGAITFSVTAASGPSLTYQWKRDNINILNATNSSLYLPLVTLGSDNASSYSCALTNLSNGSFAISTNAILTVVPEQTLKAQNYESLIATTPGLVAYFPIDGDTGSTITNTAAPSRSGVLDGGADYSGSTDRSFGQRALSIDRANNIGEVMLANDPDYSFPNGAGSIEAVVYMGDQGAYINNGSIWSFPTIFSIGEADQTAAVLSTAVGVSKVGDALEATPDGTTFLSWPVPRNLLGRFAHVAFVFDQTGITAYADGKSLGVQGPYTPVSSGSPAWIGNAGSYTNEFTGTVWNGTIDELAVYTNNLNAAAINAHYSMFLYGTNTPPVIISPPSSVTLFAGAAQNSATFSVSAEGTLPLSYQWNSNSVPVPGATNAALNLFNLNASSSATYSVTVKNPVSSTNVTATLAVVSPSGYPAAVIADNPVGYWRLDEASGPTALDSWGTNNGTYSGVETFGQAGSDAGGVNTSVDFSGNGASLVRVPYNPGFNGGNNANGSWTVEAWVNPDLDAATEGGLFAVPVASVDLTQDRSGYFFLEQADGWQLRLGNDSGYISGWDGGAGSFGTAASPNTWYYLVGEYDGAAGMGYVYINGVQVKSAVVSGLANNTAATFNIADRGDGAPFAGRIDEVATYDAVLSAARIQAHYAAAQPSGPLISATLVGSSLKLQYSAGVLYSSPNVAGPYSIVTGATSPYSTPTSGAQSFYILRTQ